MKVNAIKCKKCNSIVFSRARHDMRFCPCATVAIDGGRDYCKVSFRKMSDYTSMKIDVNLTEKELHDDWNLSKDKFGIINAKKTRRKTT